MVEWEKFNLSEWTEAEIVLKQVENAPKQHGKDCYKFQPSKFLKSILLSRGWTIKKETKNLLYLTAPVLPPFIIKIKLPTREQALSIANTLHKNGKSLRGELEELWFEYLHEEERKILHPIKPEENNGSRVIPSYWVKVISTLTIRVTGLFLMRLEKTDGDFVVAEEEVEWKKSLPPSLFDMFSDAAISDLQRQKTFKEPEKGNEFDSDAPNNVEPLSPENERDTQYFEGQELNVTLTIYERDPKARKKCIQHFGTSCQICGFDFAKVFGEIGVGFIHVHHVSRISDQGGEYEVDPIKHLIPLCPNCHAMAHRKNPPFTIEELRDIYLKVNRQ